MKKNDDIAKKLLAYCKRKPFKLTDKFKFSKDEPIGKIKLINIAKAYPQFFIYTNEAVFSKEFLKEFWLKELKLSLENSDDIDLKTLLSKGNQILHFGLHVRPPYFKNIEVSKKNKLDSNFWNTYSDTLDENKTRSKKGIYFEDYLVEILNLPESNEYELKNDVIARKTTKSRLIFGVIYHLLLQINRELPLDSLLDKINGDNNIFNIDKPIDHDTLLEEICNNEDPKRFLLKEVNQNNIIVKLRNFLDNHKEMMKQNRYSYDDIMEKDFSLKSGVLAIGISADDFPVNETKEYLKLRNYLKIINTTNLDETLQNLFNAHNSSDYLSFFGNMIAIFNNQYHFEDWFDDWGAHEFENEDQAKFYKSFKQKLYWEDLFNNKKVFRMFKPIINKLFFSFIPMEPILAQELAVYLKIELSPILNFEEYTGNLFTEVIKRNRSWWYLKR
jgi:hypothetical protein